MEQERSSPEYKRGYIAGYAAGMRRSPPKHQQSGWCKRLNPQQAADVEWYHQYGRHPERIRHDRNGNQYVIGDASWNVPGRPQELIEHLVPKCPLPPPPTL